jgi:hypothetical protein
MSKTSSVSFRLTTEARRLLQAIAEKKGLSMTGALEVLIRDEAERKGIK